MSDQKQQPGTDVAAVSDTALTSGSGALSSILGDIGMPPSLRILLDPSAHDRVKSLAMMMAQAQGFTPKHLVGKPAACHVVINMALDWKLSPYFVARGTYETPGGAIGFEGKLVQAILEQSGRFIGAPEFRYVGDWNCVLGKFTKKISAKGREFVTPSWTDTDAVGLGVIVSWQIRGETKPRVWPGVDQPFQLVQCQPRNSPLWATDPKTQIQYLAIRRFANVAAPGILGGMPFDIDEIIDAADGARDITPKGAVIVDDDIDPLGDASGMPPSTEMITVIDNNGQEHAYAERGRVTQALDIVITEAESKGIDALRKIYEANKPALRALIRSGGADDANVIKLRIETAGKRLAEEAEEAADDEVRPQDTIAGAGAPLPGDGGIAPGSTVEVEVGKLAEAKVIEPKLEPAITAPASESNWHKFWRSDASETMFIAAPERHGKKDWNAWLALVQPRLADCPRRDLLDVFMAYNQEGFGQYEDYVGERAYADLARLIEAAQERLGAK